MRPTDFMHSNRNKGNDAAYSTNQANNGEPLRHKPGQESQTVVSNAYSYQKILTNTLDDLSKRVQGLNFFN